MCRAGCAPGLHAGCLVRQIEMRHWGQRLVRGRGFMGRFGLRSLREEGREGGLVLM